MELGICDNAILDSQAKFDVEVPPTVWSIDEMGLNYACLNSLTFLDYRKSAILNSEDALRDFIIRMFKVEYQDMKITRLTDIQREKRLAIDKFGEDFHNDLDVYRHEWRYYNFHVYPVFDIVLKDDDGTSIVLACSDLDFISRRNFAIFLSSPEDTNLTDTDIERIMEMMINIIDKKMNSYENYGRIGIKPSTRSRGVPIYRE